MRGDSISARTTVDASHACATLGQVSLLMEEHSVAGATRALLVDDDPNTLSALCMVLQKAGYHVVSAASGETAIAFAREFTFDVAICDRNMPGGMDGIELLQQLRAIQPMCQRVLLTGGLDLDTAVSAVNRGAINCVLEKPIRAKSLIEVVGEALQERRRLVKAYRDLEEGTCEVERKVVRDVLNGDFLHLAMQPIVRSRDGTAFGYEALLRSSHPNLTGPTSVLQAVERHGLVGDLAGVVATLALGWLETSPASSALFINLHPAELGEPDALRERLRRLQTHARRVVLEVTERSSIYGVRAWEDSVAVIRGLGFEIAVDDLGAGYSALSVLAELQPRYIKVDMSIIRDSDRQLHKQRLLDLLCRFADATGSLLVAEGIETRAEALTVQACGAHLLQGYFFGRPRLPANLRLVAESEQLDPVEVPVDVA